MFTTDALCSITLSILYICIFEKERGFILKQTNYFNKVILISIFAALCCAGTFVQIRMPAGDFVHLGNFVMIVAALLLGGVSGGFVGSLGMGIYDLIFYSDKPSTIIRTFILKFIIGFIVGFLFRIIIKKKVNASVWLYVLSGLFGFIFILSLIFFILGSKADFNITSGFNSVYKTHILGKSASIKISLYVPIFSIIFTIFALVGGILSYKLTVRQKAVLLSVMVAIFINILGEFILRWILEGLLVSDFVTSFVVATSKIPGSIITGFISIVLSVLVYEPVYRAVKDSPAFHDDTVEESDTNEIKEELINE